MKFIPILFSTAMVQAIIDGRKNQTRRLLKKQPDSEKHTHISKGVVLDGKNREVFMFCTGKSSEVESIFCPYGQPGDVLWVRESFSPLGDKPWTSANVSYKTAAVDSSDKGWNWKPSIHMPKKACRLFLQIKTIRVERLNDISESDAIAEGVKDAGFFEGLYNYYSYLDNIFIFKTAKDSFHSLWYKINGPTSWVKNPWVWVIEFERIEKPDNFC